MTYVYIAIWYAIGYANGYKRKGMTLATQVQNHLVGIAVGSIIACVLYLTSL